MTEAITAAWVVSGMVTFGVLYASDDEFERLASRDFLWTALIVQGIWPILVGILITKWARRK